MVNQSGQGTPLVLYDLVAGTYVPSSQDGDHPQQGGAEDEQLTTLLAEVRQRSGIDFSGCRRPSILRRRTGTCSHQRLPCRIGGVATPEFADRAGSIRNPFNHFNQSQDQGRPQMLKLG
jgi:hypothetical protein